MKSTDDKLQKRRETIEKLQLAFGGGVVASVTGMLGWIWWKQEPPKALNPQELKKALDDSMSAAAKSVIKDQKKAMEYVKDPGKWMKQKKETLGIVAFLSAGAGVMLTLAHFMSKWEENNKKKALELYNSDTEYGRKFRELMGKEKIDASDIQR